MKNNNYCVIMGGGIGSRFWPFSKEDRPKQFLDFFGTGRSLLQSTYDRFKKIIPVENIFVVTNDAYAELTLKQLPELSKEQVLLEPLRRNTAPAIAYSLFHIQAINPEANIVVAPSDHLILKEDLFLSEIERGLDFVEKHPVLLTLGIKPNRPETGYGYIQESNEEVDGIRKVKTFTEKPNLELARVFYESGEFVWNSGIFLWNVKAILEAFKIHLPDIVNKFNEGREFFNTPREKEFIDQAFPFCSSISIDYGIMEKADNVYVIGSDFGWSDLGTWGSLHEITPKDENNNASLHCKTLYVESNDNVVAMSDDKLVVIQGLEGYIVAESEKALLICKKEEEQRIKHFVTDVKFRFGDEYV
ncbi:MULTISPECIES: mannose-1-phosphate guanylyltransferase [Petrimonas]|jgi:mannose-1-phosphate guanylyltransferase|uniref:mannose-1-phosphate guanylyltransferase n=1 Tax=Petrimonas mucosa TaxID=1642646 RepID=A0A1G4GAJ6_9BACT|nr:MULTISPECIES: mannose-1-phosphate guanylyltransferase [Petrimonas]MDD3560830.1 mannose-1-phosphate guanylyltransferase [Petrimonas mucosa]SCM59528.1 Mannose-1-phosphate guanylyltransferase [Petrimonas mucosa]SFU36714.1 mannose-1-phosphate guanylyltransferase (GDP) [Porphyromonadaceae bacterium KHP3R9]HHT30829.1 mannose-1-phosphate guanylyltransferase [Petrimonas mucosa]